VSNSLAAASLRLAVEASINLALQADPACQLKLQALAGKSIALHITDMNLRWCVYLNYPLVLLDAGDTPADSQLAGRLQDFIGVSVKPGANFSQTGISHSGDIQLLNTCLQLMKSLDLDVGALISAQAGPLAGALSDQLGAVFTHVNTTLAKAPLFIGDYLQHELQLIPSKHHIDAFTADIHLLRSATDRLNAHIERFNARLDQALHSLPPHV
jgi:ubiquinone biosynthesis accessory factor UbiJ